jgi:glycosyltransferase involved in cell wall biosynthesis
MSNLDQSKSDILCFSSSDWDGVWGSRQQVMLRFAERGYRVLYIEQLAGLEHWLRYPDLRSRRKQHQTTSIRAIAANLWAATPPWIAPGRYFAPFINQLNGKIIEQWLKPILFQMQFNKILLWVYKPEHSTLIGKFHEKTCIYHCIDEWTAGTLGRKRKVITDLENLLLQRADLVFANSPPTYLNKRRLNPHTYRLPSGVDEKMFRESLDPSTPEHSALHSIPLPRIGYVGSINERLDYSIIEASVEHYSHYSFVFIGDTYPWSLNAPQLLRLKAYNNVYFMGKFPFSEIPSLLKGIQVCLLPYKDDESAYYRSPLKLYEYLAAGKPVVSTDNPEIREASQLIYISTSKDDFIKLIQAGLEQDDPELKHQRVAFAKENTWDRRVDKMEALIQSTIQNRQW